MSEQPLDLRRSAQILWRYKVVVGAVAAVGLAGGITVTVLRPPMLASQALVVLPPSVTDTRTQELVARSDPVLVGGLRSLDSDMSLTTLRSRIQTGSPANDIVSITAQGETAALAERTANRVARSYVRFLGSGTAPFSTGRRPFSAVPARVMQRATDATGTSLPMRMLIIAGLGALSGFLVGCIAALGIGRSDRRLRDRDEIAASIGVPVLASIAVAHPSQIADWRKLLGEYEPGAVDAWRLRKALQDLGLTDGDPGRASLAVLSLSSDPKALAVGPQLAVFAASLGIPTRLVIGPAQDANVTAMLRAACAAPSAGRSKNLRLAVSDHADAEWPGAALTIVVAVVDGSTPQIAVTMRTTATVLGVSAGNATAEQLARVAARAAGDDRHVTGIVVADPEPADHTTGRLPQLPRPAGGTTRVRVTGMPTGARG